MQAIPRLTVLTAGSVLLLLLGGCAGRNVADQHASATTGFGLGPQEFNSNGGAFGPDQSSH